MIRAGTRAAESKMSFINPVHLAFVAIVALVVLGPKRFPEVMRSVGKGYREFREQLSAVTAQAQSDLSAPAAGTPTIEHASVVEQVSPEREVRLAPPDAETSVTGAVPAGAPTNIAPVPAPPLEPPPAAPPAQ